jgi:hypothetical protein
MNVSFTRNISNEELELVKANQALKAAEEQRRNIEKYAKLQELAKQAAAVAEAEAMAAKQRAVIAAANTKKELECLWIDDKKKGLYNRAKEKLLEFIQILDDGKLLQYNARTIQNEIRNLESKVLDNLAKKANSLKDNFNSNKKKNNRTRKRREAIIKPLEQILEDTSSFPFMVFFLVNIAFIMSNKMQLSNYTVVNCLLGLYGQWRGFREFAAECAGIKKTKVYKETPVSTIDEKWKKAASKVGFIKPKPKPIVHNPKPKPKLNELFGRNRKGKSEELPTVYESYRKPPELKSALKKTSSFGPQVAEKPKYLTQDQLTPKKLMPKQKRTVMSFSDERFSHFSSYPNDLRPPTDTSFGRDWIVGKNNKY